MCIRDSTHGILVRYADDTVIICKNKKSANHALNLLQYIMVKLDLKLHPVKTKIVSMWDGKEGFDFQMCIRDSRNIKQYMKAALFNAPSTIGSYYTSLVSHDMYGLSLIHI